MDTDGQTAITEVRQIDFSDESAVAVEIEAFRIAHANDEIEHALVFSPDGNMYRLRGSSYNVNIEILDPGALRGSRVIHNHPASWPDSFGRNDFEKFFELGIWQEEVVFGHHHNIMRYSGIPITMEGLIFNENT